VFPMGVVMGAGVNVTVCGKFCIGGIAGLGFVAAGAGNNSKKLSTACTGSVCDTGIVWARGGVCMLTGGAVDCDETTEEGGKITVF